MQTVHDLNTTPHGVGRSPWKRALALGMTLSGLMACGQEPMAGIADDLAVTMDALKIAKPLSPVSAGDRCLEPENGKLNNGARVRLVACNGSGTQQWEVDTDTGLVAVRGGKLCLDVVDGIDRKGTALQLWDCNKDNVNQQFDVNGSALVWRKGKKCLGLEGGVKPNAPLQILMCNNTANSQAWNLAQTSGGGTQPGNSGKNTAPNGGQNSGSGQTDKVDFGPTVLIFDSGMSMQDIQAKMNDVYNKQRPNHFGPERFAYLFKPGSYNLDVKIGFGMTAAGLGASPDDVQITGAVRVKGDFLPDNNATQNFWRGVENMSVVPTQDNGALVWAISQGTSFRRMHVRGNMNLSDNGWSSGGFVADSKIDGTIDSGSQQQFLTRNTTYGRWNGSNWNMVFVGDKNAPSGAWPNAPYSVVEKTPVIREKPYLAVDGAGRYVVRNPQTKRSSVGNGWGSGQSQDAEIPISKFYIAKSSVDNADSINAALDKGLHVIFTPGLYNLNKSLQVRNANTILLGMGIATLRATQGDAVITTADVDGLSISGFVVDAGPTNSKSLFVVGQSGSSNDHTGNPAALHDISCRVGGAGKGRTTACLTINSRDVILDNTWLWRADHGDGANWYDNPSLNGIVVNGANVTAYGLFSEHFQEYQTLWNGENGTVYMYQSELPYDPPNQDAWQHDGVAGWASYKVANSVKQHKALGMGVYAFFHNRVRVDSAIESPNVPGVTPQHIVTVWLGQAEGSEVTHIINGWGDTANSRNRVIRTPW